MRAARILCHPAGLAIAAKAITFSTAGWVPCIRRCVLEEQPYRLAFSLTSAIPAKRAQLMPIERTWPLPELVQAIREYATSRRERAMLAYVIIRDFNTAREDAEALAQLFRGVPIKLDLIEVNDPTGRYLAPLPDELRRFRDELQILRARLPAATPVERRSFHRFCGGRLIELIGDAASTANSHPSNVASEPPGLWQHPGLGESLPVGRTSPPSRRSRWRHPAAFWTTRLTCCSPTCSP